MEFCEQSPIMGIILTTHDAAEKPQGVEFLLSLLLLLSTCDKQQQYYT